MVFSFLFLLTNGLKGLMSYDYQGDRTVQKFLANVEDVIAVQATPSSLASVAKASVLLERAHFLKAQWKPSSNTFLFLLFAEVVHSDLFFFFCFPFLNDRSFSARTGSVLRDVSFTLATRRWVRSIAPSSSFLERDRVLSANSRLRRRDSRAFSRTRRPRAVAQPVRVGRRLFQQGVHRFRENGPGYVRQRRCPAFAVHESHHAGEEIEIHFFSFSFFILVLIIRDVDEIDLVDGRKPSPSSIRQSPSNNDRRMGRAQRQRQR
jgi:hypothetical protein